MSHLPIGEPVLPEITGEGQASRLTLAELEHALWVADPMALLILPRILRRVIKQDCGIAGFGFGVPHRKSYVIARQPLLQIVDKAELGLTDDSELPEKVVLLARPGARRLANTPAGDMLIRCWRLLFHSRIHAVLDARMASGELSPVVVRRAIRQIGVTEFEEIRQVLAQENLLLQPQSDVSVYVEFVAVYLELRYFAHSFLRRYFPGLRNLETVDALVCRAVDAETLFRLTRPYGAPLPEDHCVLDELIDLPTEPELPVTDVVRPVERPSKRKYRALMRQSQRPASLGNVVGAAIYRARAARFAPPEFVGHVRSAIQTDVYRLIRRLQAALELNQLDPQPWQQSLFALVNQTPYGIWTAEARLLYDLQKVCVDHERGIYTVDLVEWALSRGRRPIKRELPYQRGVLMLKHLRSAGRRLAAVRLTDNERRQLALLIGEAMKRVEARLRQELRPQIIAALDAVGLVGQNLPERVARKKLVEELLDQIGERGFLTMGNLRDAISRNNLKLPDLFKPVDLLHGDQLLRADRKLALLLDGVYRRGEFYLRWMQRVSSVGFGTRIGRFLTRFAIVPFGGAYVALAGVHHVWEMIVGAKSTAEMESVDPVEATRTIVEGGFRLTSPTVVLALGLLLLCVINSSAFRSVVGVFFKTLYRVFRAIVVEPIRWIVQSPLLQRILRSRPFSILLRFIVKPFVGTDIALRLLPIDETNWHVLLGTSASIFLALNLLLNSRLGRNVEEVLVDWVVQGWHRFGLRAITGLFWLIVDLFKAILETVERLMYTVDEWLRFKSGERKSTFAMKAVLGLLWFFLAYVLRFAVNVLIEPQINPVKHFPVVTVSHKLLLPLIPSAAAVLENTMEKALAWTVAATTIWCIPGIFGFLVWELKENWRLYAANRRHNLSPALIGSHGETMTRLLKLGFHSGTLPKRYAKLRHAERHARADGDWRSVRKHMQILHHIEVSIRRYVEREFLELFVESRCWQAPPVTLERVWLGTNSVRLAIGCPGVRGANLLVSLEVEGGWLVAGIVSPGWIDQLRPQQRQVLATALLGLYRTAGAELVRQQIERLFVSRIRESTTAGVPSDAGSPRLGQAPSEPVPSCSPSPPLPWYGFSAEGLMLWPDKQDGDAEVLYDFHNGPWIAPQSVCGLARQMLPTAERRQLIFADVPIPWDAWVVIWNQDVAGQGHPLKSVVPVLP